MTRRLQLSPLRILRLSAAVTRSACVLAPMMLATRLHAQPSPGSKATAQKSMANTAALSPALLIGTWNGTATVPLKDSSIVVPVFYTFTQTGSTLGGTAVVPGQGQGPISNVIITGNKIHYRVTAPEAKLLEHDGELGKDGAIEGLVMLDKLPVAKFRIAPKKAAKGAP